MDRKDIIDRWEKERQTDRQTYRQKYIDRATDIHIYVYTQHTYTMEYYLAINKKQWNLAICDNMNGPRLYYTKWNKSAREGQIRCDVTYMWNLKKQTKKVNKQDRNSLTDIEKKLMVAKR